MKNLVLIALCFLVMSLTCKKNEPRDFLPGNWGILTYKENDIDKTADFNIEFQGYKLTFDAKGNYSEFHHPFSTGEKLVTGTWTLENNNLQLVFVDNDPNSASKIRTFDVLGPITSTELNIKEGIKEYDLRKQ